MATDRPEIASRWPGEDYSTVLDFPRLEQRRIPSPDASTAAGLTISRRVIVWTGEDGPEEGSKGRRWRRLIAWAARGA